MATVTPGRSLQSPLLSEHFRPLARVVWTRHTDAVVLLDADRGLYYTLNEIAGRIWELLAAGEPVIEILRCLKDEYDVSSEMLEEDVSRVLVQLLETQLIERVSG